jgi:hypothetical protein
VFGYIIHQQHHLHLLENVLILVGDIVILENA